MTKASRTFQTAEDFTCVDGVLKDGEMHEAVEAKYESGVRFTLENIAKPNWPPVYFHHAKSMLFTESRIAFLLKHKCMGEIFPESSTEE